MTCNFDIKAKNGQTSMLFKDFVKNSNNPDAAINSYFYTKTEDFKKIFGDWENDEVDSSLLDINGEPKYAALSNEKYNFDIDYSEVELDSKATVYKEIMATLPVIISKVDDSITNLKKSDGPEGLIASLETLKKELVDEDITVSIPKFLKMADNHVQKMKDRAEKEIASGDVDIKKLARIYKDSQSYSIVPVLQANLFKNHEIKHIFKEDLFGAGSTLNNMHAIEVLYLEQGKKFLARKFHEKDPSWAMSDIRQWLDQAPRDVAFMEQQLEYLGDSADKVLAAVAEIVQDANHKVREKTIEFSAELEEKLVALEKASKGVKSSELFKDILYDKNGEIHILDIDAEFTDGKVPASDAMYNKVQTIKRSNPALYDFLEFFSDTYMSLQTALPPASRMGTRIPSVLKSTFERSIGSGVKDRLSQVSDEMKKSIMRSNMDMERNPLLDATGKQIKRIPVFYTQSYDTADYDVFYSQEYNTAKKAGKTDSEAVEIATRTAKEKASKKNSELISKDLAYSLQSFFVMTTNYAEKNAIMDVIESSLAVVGSDARQYVLTDSGGITFMKKIKNAAGGDMEMAMTDSGKNSTAKKALETFIDMQVYGIMDKDLGYFDIMGAKMDTAKVIRQVNSYTSWVQMATNVLASLANIGNGEYSNTMEAIGGEYYKIKNYHKASAEYRKHLGSTLADVGARTPKGFIGLLNQKYNMLGNYSPKGEVQAVKNSWLKRVVSPNLLFFLQGSGEHFMQVRAGMAVLDAVSAFDKNGTAIGSLLTVEEVVNNKLAKKEVYIKNNEGELILYDSDQQNKMANKISAVIRRSQGNYNPTTANKMKQDARTALVMKYRDWVYDGLVRRYGKKQPYKALGQDAEGFYRTGARVGKNMVKHLTKFQFALMQEDWSKLTPHEKANIRRLITETAMITLLGVSGAMLGKAGKMVEDEYNSDDIMDRMTLGSFNLLAYEVNRLWTEVFAYANPVEALRLMQTPAASTSILEGVVKLTNQTMTDVYGIIQGEGPERYESGWREGDLKIGARIEKLTPLYKNIKTLNPEGIKERGVFYNF